MPIGFRSTPSQPLRSQLARAGVFAFALLPATAFAQAGVRELNQTCAVQTGCFAGDAAGFPISIDGTSGRSYRLTSDLVVPDENTTAISLTTSAVSVSIDLGGFEITRAACVGSAAVCLPTTGSGDGIGSLGTPPNGVSVRNGTVSGMGNRGVFLGNRSEIIAVRARWNRGDGLRVGSFGAVRDSNAYDNGAIGLSAGGASVVSGNVSAENDVGISVSNGSTVIDNSVFGNSSFGILAALASTVSRNSVSINGGDGIQVGPGGVVTSNTSFNNTGDGIQTSSGCTVESNAIRGNTSFGLNLSSQSGYRGNVISANTGGTISGTTLVNLGGNACNGSTTCP